MIVNRSLDFELSKEESEQLLNVLMSPSSELEKKRKAFFAQGDNIDISVMDNGDFVAEIEDLDLSFLDGEKSYQTLSIEHSFVIGKQGIDLHLGYQQYMAGIEIEFDDEMELLGDNITAMINPYSVFSGGVFSSKMQMKKRSPKFNKGAVGIGSKVA